MESIEPILRGGIRGIVSLLIATLFLLILMVASAQQEAINALQRADSKISYSVAHKIMADAVQAERERAPFETENRNLRAENRRLKQEGDKPDAELIEKWGTVTGIGQRIARAGTCELGDANPEFNALWTAIETCVADGRTSPAIAREVQALQASESNPRVLLRRLNELSRRVKLNDEAILDNDKRITELQAKITAAETARNSLQDVATLESLGVVRWLSLTRIPPALMGILMCFSAGLFGALLITLILTVYPKSDLGFTTSNSYWSRILLGGLIAWGCSW
ncbi:MAG: hypothetical protein WDN24_22550 [Sphingomonas sp.]